MIGDLTVRRSAVTDGNRGQEGYILASNLDHAAGRNNHNERTLSTEK